MTTPENDLPPRPKDPRYTYVAEGTCSDCGRRFPMTARMVYKTTLTGDHRERPKCSTCRRVKTTRKAKRAEKKLKRPAEIKAGYLCKVRLRHAPASGVPQYCNFTSRWFISYFTLRGRGLAREEKRAYLEADTEGRAITEAHDWYVRALLHGAQWLPGDFTRTRVKEPWTPEERAARRALAALCRVEFPKHRHVIKAQVLRHKVRVYRWATRYRVRVQGVIVARNIVSKSSAMALAAERRVNEPAPEPALKPCLKCGVPPVWDGNKLVHEGGEYCANAVMVRDMRFSRRSKIALWNRVLRTGYHAGWWDFRLEHVLLDQKIRQVVTPLPAATGAAADPLDGFEI